MGKKSLRTFGALVVALACCGLAVGAAGAGIGYDSVPSPLPGNVPSVGFEARATSELGDEVQFAGTDRVLRQVTVTMSSWGCESGTWNGSDCSTTPGATFTHPLTLTVYAVDTTSGHPEPGAVLATRTQTFAIPYRPSASASCGDGRWSNGTTCFNGFATPVTFDFTGTSVTLPGDVIWGVAYSTTHYGALPLGESAPCYTSDGGCGYDSLNVGTAGTTPSVGTDPNPDGIFQNSASASSYCDGAAGTFRFDDGCWGGSLPQARFELGGTLGDCVVSTDTVEKRIDLLADCTTDETIVIPNGYTFDGNEHTITAVDPAGGHFRGAILQNAGATANVVDLNLTASGLVDACDGGTDALAGVRLLDASGSISNVDAVELNQGHASGCQEGDAFEFRSSGTITRTVTVTGSSAVNYQKTGVLVSGAVVATVSGNTVSGYGPSTVIAQNGIQVSFGASAVVERNTISNNDYTLPAWVACGLLTYDAKGVRQSKNVFVANEKNVCNYGRGGGQVSPS
jgi:hypothetical protein